MYDNRHFTRDAAIVEFPSSSTEDGAPKQQTKSVVRFDEDAPGITVDDDGETQFDWDSVERVTVDDPPHANAFETKDFYRIPATVAKPIPQPYQFGEDTVWLKKPREELKKAAWSLDNAPWTHDHPDTGMVKSVDDVKGFWRNPRYIDGTDDLDADLHVPVHDEESKQFLEDNSDVSVGFYNQIARVDDYDGTIGGEDHDGVDLDGYQTDMMFDHVASVGMGRCPSDAGCGIDSPNHGHVDEVSFKRDTRITHKPDDTGEGGSPQEQTDSMRETTDAPSGIHTADGKWFAVGPDEHPDESTEYADDAKFPVDSCSDIQDAWNLRGTGDIDIDESTLESRIQRAAEAMDCDLNTETSDAMVAVSAKRYSVCGSRDVGDSGCGHNPTNNDNTMTNVEISFDDLSTEAAIARLTEQNDGAAERIEELRDAQETAEVAREAADEADVDDVSDLPDAIGMLADRKEELEQKVSDLEDQIDELQRPEMEEDAEFIAERTDRYGEDADEVIEHFDGDREEIADKRELVADLTEESYDEATANPETDEPNEPTVDESGYVSTPWDN